MMAMALERLSNVVTTRLAGAAAGWQRLAKSDRCFRKVMRCHSQADWCCQRLANALEKLSNID
jgi:hypothetical protein